MEHLLQVRVARPKILNVKFGHKDFKKGKNPQNLMINKATVKKEKNI